MAIVYQGHDVFEKNVQQLPYTFEQSLLEDYVKQVITKYPENNQIRSWGRGYGGWIIQGRKDDPVLRQWDSNVFSKVSPDNFEEWLYENIAQCYHRTDIAKNDFISDTLRSLEDLGLNPRRMRLSKLAAGSTLKIHNDMGFGIKKYAVRFHIPCITNQEVQWIMFDEKLNTRDFNPPEKNRFNEWIEQNEDKVICRFHLEAGKSYMIRTNNIHTVTNPSDQDRYHINCNIWDTSDSSKFPFNSEYAVDLDTQTS